MLVSEIFFSLQGESSSAGLPTVFIRTAGCHLRCSYCDTAYARHGGTAMTVEEVFSQATAFGCRRFCLTGGEPLLQPAEEVQQLIDLLAPYELSIETSGAIDVGRWRLHPAHRWVLDVKCPSSGETGRMDLRNLERLRPVDEVKFVVGDAADYAWARGIIRAYGLERRSRVLFSPVFGVLAPALLAGWLLEDRLEARLSLQVHKYIWGPEARGV